MSSKRRGSGARRGAGQGGPPSRSAKRDTAPGGAPRWTFFATCAPGVEPLLHAEVKELGFARSERQVGGVKFEGSMADARRANLMLRTAVRVLRREARFDAPSERAFIEGAQAIDWSSFLQPDGALWIDAQSKESALNHTRYLSQLVKDVIVDQIRTPLGDRPTVDRESADLRVHVHLFRDRATLSVDTSGASLHRRGWRTFQGRAPLSETLAAALVLHSKWDRRSPVIDPFCGTGTVLVEAAMIASGAAPGLTRKRFGFESWQGHDEAAWGQERAAAEAAVTVPKKLRLVGRDIERNRLDEVRAHFAGHPWIAELADRVELEQADARRFEHRPGWNAWVISNMPYGERVGEHVEELHGAFGESLSRMDGDHACLLTGSTRLAGLLRLKGHERARILNGGIECQVVTASIGQQS